VPVLVTSSATGAGLDELARELLRRVPDRILQSVPAGGGDALAAAGVERGAGAAGGAAGPGDSDGEEALVEHMVFRPGGRAGFQVRETAPGAFAVRGRGVERLLARYDIENEDAMAYLEGRLRRIGVIRALEAEGFQPGDEIEIGGVSFELDPGPGG
jgi:GTP-binding protein